MILIGVVHKKANYFFMFIIALQFFLKSVPHTTNYFKTAMLYKQLIENVLPIKHPHPSQRNIAGSFVS